MRYTKTVWHHSMGFQLETKGGECTSAGMQNRYDCSISKRGIIAVSTAEFD